MHLDSEIQSQIYTLCLYLALWENREKIFPKFSHFFAQNGRIIPMIFTQGIEHRIQQHWAYTQNIFHKKMHVF